MISVNVQEVVDVNLKKTIKDLFLNKTIGRRNHELSFFQQGDELKVQLYPINGQIVPLVNPHNKSNEVSNQTVIKIEYENGNNIRQSLNDSIIKFVNDYIAWAE